MPGFASYDDLISEITAGGKIYNQDFYKAMTAAQAAGQWHSGWLGTGLPGAGVAPATTPGTKYVGTVLAPVAGSINFPDQASDYKHLLSFSGVSPLNCMLMVYDRLYGVSGVSLTTTGDRTLDNGTIGIDRYTDGVGVIPCLEVTTPSTTTAAVVNLKLYKDELGANVGPAPNFTLPALATVLSCLMPLPLLGASKGCRNVQTLNVVIATTNCVCNVVLIKPLAYLPIVGNIGNERDLVLQLAALPRIYNGACLAFAYFASATTVTNIFGQLRVGYG